MISSVSLQNLRGVKSGEVTDLSALTILIGPNGSGKSTVLDALSLSATAELRDAIVAAVRRRGESPSLFRWLIYAQGDAARIVTSIHGEPRTVVISRAAAAPPANSLGSLEVVVRDSRDKLADLRVSFLSGTSGYHTNLRAESGFEDASVDTRFVDLRRDSGPPNKLLTDAKTQGLFDAALDTVRGVVGELKNIEILQIDEEGKEYGLFTTFADRSVPLAVAGDGVQALVRLSLELAAPPGGLVLLEEPEVHQHPRSLAMSAKAIVAASKRGSQIVLATHSLELIDLLLSEAMEQAHLPALSVQKVQLKDGQLTARRFDAEQVKRLRREIEAELR